MLCMLVDLPWCRTTGLGFQEGKLSIARYSAKLNSKDKKLFQMNYFLQEASTRVRKRMCVFAAEDLFNV
jgi:hypothetical protein